MRRWTLIAAVWLAAASCTCRAPGVGNPEQAWVVSPEHLDFGTVYVGHPATGRLEVTNRSRVAARLQLAADAPFTAASPLELPGGETLTVEVKVLATQPGPLAGVLTLDDGERTANITLSASALQAPACGETACRVTRFDPVQGQCVSEPAPDGVACRASCLEGASCRQGFCVGQPRSCDDSNACTADSCDPDHGCTHPAVVCRPGADPCQVPVCDRLTGCGLADAPDGTRCGAADCAFARICLSGRCVSSRVPEGAACAEDSPCQRAGVCRERVCVRPPPGRLHPIWTYQPAHQMQFQGLTDEAGSLYWVEMDALGAGELVSATIDGAIRYRRPLSTVQGYGTQMLAGLAFVMTTSAGTTAGDYRGHLEARRMSDGAFLWSSDIVPGLISPADLSRYDPVTTFVYASWLASNGHGLAYLGVSVGSTTGSAPESFVVAVDLASGALQWKQPHRDVWYLSADEAGNAYFREGPPQSSVSAVSLSADGGLRWEVDGGMGIPQALADGRWWSSYQLFDTSNGAGSLIPSYAHGAVASRGFVTRAVSQVSWYSVERRDLSSGALVWSVPSWAGGPGSELLQGLIVTDQASVIAATWDGRVTEIDTDGGLGFICQLPAEVSTSHWYEWGAASLAHGRLVTYEVQPSVLSSFIINRDPADAGWICEGGSMARDRRPR